MHPLHRSEEVAGAGDVALGFLLARRDRLVVATLASHLGVLGQGEEFGVESIGGEVLDPEQVPSAAVRSGVLVVLGETRAGGVEHRVVRGASRTLPVTGGEDFARHRQSIARLLDELLRARAHAAPSPLGRGSSRGSP